MSGETGSTSARNELLDIEQVKSESGAPRFLERVTGTRTDRFQVVIRREALDQVHTHGREVTDVEICGVLVGTLQHDDRGPYLLVEAAVRGSKASSRAAQVTFTAETWAAIQEVMDRDHPDGKIVGWYHTHPGFGVFLSGMDLFIQDHFFNLPWQVALVYDPLSGEDGLFVWRKGRSEPDAILIEEPLPGEAVLPEPGPSPWKRASGPRERARLSAMLDGLSAPQLWAVCLILFGAAFATSLVLGRKAVAVGRNSPISTESTTASSTRTSE